eukprot:128264_1
MANLYRKVKQLEKKGLKPVNTKFYHSPCGRNIVDYYAVADQYNVQNEHKQLNNDAPPLESDEFKFSSFEIMECKFERTNKPLGFDLQLHSQFVAIKSIEPNSTAHHLKLLPGDILLKVNDTALKKINCIDDVWSAINSKNYNHESIKIKFARKRKTFPVLICQRAGTKCVNGKYSIESKENDALLFSNNNDANFKIMRIFVNKKEDRAIWTLRNTHVKPTRDYYTALTTATNTVPPEYGWKAVGNNGLLPAPGLQYYDIPVTTPSTPTITKVEPNPNAITIHFECEQYMRKPNVCPHMETWYEIEIKHYIHNIDKEKTSKQIETLQIEMCKQSPFTAKCLINGDDYEFIVRSCNHIASTNSNKSKRITPLQLPPKPKIIDIDGNSSELFVHFNGLNAKINSIRATYKMIIESPINGTNRQYQIDDDTKPIHLQNLVNGQQYKIIIESRNCIGVTCSDPELVYPSKKPPKPILINVQSGNREIIVHFKCDGYDKSDIKAWFEMELRNFNTFAKNENNNNKSKSISQSNTDILREVYASLNMDEKSQADTQEIADEQKDHNIPYFRRNTRYFSSPARISPVVNGISYIVCVKAVTLSGNKMSAFSKPIIPKGIPPIPQINKLIPLQSSIKIEFECKDYATDEYKAKFEIEVRPNTLTTKTIKSSAYIFKKLNNGQCYKFRIRSLNKEGKSKWSPLSESVTPLLIPPKPIELRCVPFNKEITVFWVGEELQAPKYSGYYKIVSEPPTITMTVNTQQTQFTQLINGTKYRFKVSAINKVGESISEISQACIPNAKIAKQSYIKTKKQIALELKEILLQKRKKRKKQKARNKIIKVEKAKTMQKEKDKQTFLQSRDIIIEKQQNNKKQNKLKLKQEEQIRLKKKRQQDEQREKIRQKRKNNSIIQRIQYNHDMNVEKQRLKIYQQSQSKKTKQEMLEKKRKEKEKLNKIQQNRRNMSLIQRRKLDKFAKKSNNKSQNINHDISIQSRNKNNSK